MTDPGPSVVSISADFDRTKSEQLAKEAHDRELMAKYSKKTCLACGKNIGRKHNAIPYYNKGLTGFLCTDCSITGENPEPKRTRWTEDESPHRSSPEDVGGRSVTSDPLLTNVTEAAASPTKA